ncbi:YceI family protein [Pseudorhodoferax sp. Leaf267]|uniref:YceI family protein n=1 Tax=Pseudorhodoferax sp. Leaf267 TaxID=1736316 RepID=UPI0006F2DDD4|nr:YceI family protein [Pseudorhodoferax sp. Leaf267]KQP22860.1 hypothetical protein ASF43_02920 [Pseudorhodoferax sp. Leaf267]
MKNPLACAPAAVLSLALAAACVATVSAQSVPNAMPEMPARPGGQLGAGARYVVDPTHTFVMYEMGHYGTSTNRGRFSTKDGQVQIDAAGTSGTVDITIDMGTINTGVDLLNRHVQSRDFLNVADYPTARFTAERMVLEGGMVREIPGALTMLGQTHPVTLRATRFNCYMSPIHGQQVCGGDFDAVIERSQWGITWGLQFGFEDKVRLLTQIEAVRIGR